MMLSLADATWEPVEDASDIDSNADYARITSMLTKANSTAPMHPTLPSGEVQAMSMMRTLPRADMQQHSAHQSQ